MSERNKGVMLQHKTNILLHNRCITLLNLDLLNESSRLYIPKIFINNYLNYFKNKNYAY